MSLKFRYEIKKEIARLDAQLSNDITQSAKAMWKTAVNATPRITGTAQAGWKLSTSRRSSYVPVRRKQQRPATPDFRFRVTRHKRFYFYNNVPYIKAVNDGLGPGIRVPRFMMEKARDRFVSEMRIRNLKR